MFTAPSAATCPNWRRSTSSGWMACQAGPIRAVPHPSRKVRPSSKAGVSASANASTDSVVEAASMAN